MQRLTVPTDSASITPDWLSGILGPVRSVTSEDIGADFGFGGTTYLSTAILATGDRQRVVVKLATAERTTREITFYERCAPSTPINTPAMIGGSTNEDRGVVVLEYLPKMRQGDVLAGCSSTEFLSLATTLGRLHRRWWGAADEALDDLRFPMPAPTLIEGRADVALERYGHSVTQSLAARIDALGEGLRAVEQALSSGPMTLIHRDFHLDNILFDADGMPFVLDWQGAVVGPPAIDLARIFVDCPPQQLVPDIVKAALLHYSDELGESSDGLGELRDGVCLALERSLAFTVNWLGRSPAADPGTRMAALEAAALNSMGSAFDAVSALEL